MCTTLTEVHREKHCGDGGAEREKLFHPGGSIKPLPACVGHGFLVQVPKR